MFYAEIYYAEEVVECSVFKNLNICRNSRKYNFCSTISSFEINI